MAKKKVEHASAKIGEVIHRLGPINNKCRSADGIEKVELLWDLGDTLLEFSPNANDQLLREIHDRSYITRDLMRYGLIVRRGWQHREDLREQFPSLTCYGLFRDALPFLKGDRHGIDNETHARITEQLNDGEVTKVKAFIKKLKEEKIGRRHKKGKAVTRMVEPSVLLQDAIKQFFALAENQPSELIDFCSRIGEEAVVRLSQACVAIADGAASPKLLPFDTTLEPIASIHSALSSVAAANRNDQNGFRKAVGAVTLMELADLLNAACSTERLRQWRERRRLAISL